MQSPSELEAQTHSPRSSPSRTSGPVLLLSTAVTTPTSMGEVLGSAHISPTCGPSLGSATSLLTLMALTACGYFLENFPFNRPYSCRMSGAVMSGCWGRKRKEKLQQKGFLFPPVE